MNKSNVILATVLAGFLLAMTLAGCSKQAPAANAKPYPLDTCLVCGMKLSMMDKPFTFVYQGQQIKVCDAGEKADFEKDPAKYMKKLADAEAAARKGM
jgi:nitrous oxide reductase accessory protein NosL